MKRAGYLGSAEMIELALGQVAFAAMQIYIPWLAASQVPLSELAMLSLAQSFVWPLAMVAQLQLRTIYVARGERALFPLFVQLRLAACLLLVAGAAITSVFVRQGQLLFGVAVALALIKAVESVSDIMQAELQRTMKLRAAAHSQTWRCAIFIVVYTVTLVVSGELVTSLMAGLACMGAWVLVVDVGGRAPWREVFAHGIRLESVAATLRVGVSLSVAVALSSLAVMVGRWAALRAGDTETVAATALAGTVASIVAVVLTTIQQFSLVPARLRLAAGGEPAFRRWSSGVTRRLHMLMAGLVVACASAAVLVASDSLPFAARPGARHFQDIVVALAACFIGGGWVSVLCFPDNLLLWLRQRHSAILLIAVLQVTAAMAASLLLYPHLGWPAIGVAELFRSLAFVLAVRFTGERLRFTGEATG